MPHPLYRHGDVFLQEVTPPARALHPAGHLILARGETTGHAHRIAEANAALLYEGSGPDRYLHVTAPHATLTHEEHRPIRLPGGWYRVWQQREYTPGSVRVVLD